MTLGKAILLLPENGNLILTALKLINTLSTSLFHWKKRRPGDIVSMAHKLGHYVIAEGVEFEAQRQYLIKHECDKIQDILSVNLWMKRKQLIFLIHIIKNN